MRRLGQTSVVDNQGGGVMASQNTTKAAPDDVSRQMTPAHAAHPYHVSRIFEWIKQRNHSCRMSVDRVPIQSSKDWYFDGSILKRRDSNFFSVVGVKVFDEHGHRADLDQPLIRQPEIGILGFILSAGARGREILVQSKSEPGNVPLCQLAPSVQATVSNYERRHGGQATLFLDHFTAPIENTVLSDSLQSEQGTRFLGKYNRNMTVILPEDSRPEETEFIRWFPLRSFLHLLGQDFAINTDARSVIATTPWRDLAASGEPFAGGRAGGDFEHLLSISYRAEDDGLAEKVRARQELLHRRRQHFRFQTREVPLSELSGWLVSDDAIRHATRPLTIQQYRIQTNERETELWDQPLFASGEEGQVILLCQVHDGHLEFLFSCRAEPGFKERLQFGPTVQTLDSGENWISSELEESEACLMDVCKRARTIMTCRQSDEGGRFYRCISSYSIRMIGDSETCDSGANCAWMTLAEIEALLPQPGTFTNEARTLISMLLVYV